MDAYTEAFRRFRMTPRTQDELDGFRAGWAACVNACSDFIDADVRALNSREFLASRVRVHLLPKKGV